MGPIDTPRLSLAGGSPPVEAAPDRRRRLEPVEAPRLEAALAAEVYRELGRHAADVPTPGDVRSLLASASRYAISTLDSARVVSRLLRERVEGADGAGARLIAEGVSPRPVDRAELAEALAE